MKSGKIQARDYWYLSIGLVLLALVITCHSVYVTYQNDYYDSDLDRALTNKDDAQKVKVLLSWPLDDLSTIRQAQAYHLLSTSLYNLGQFDESELHLRKILELGPSTIGEYLLESSTYDYLHSEANLLAAEIALENKDFTRVEPLIEQALKEDPFIGGCGTTSLIRHIRINQIKIDLALATKNEVHALELLDWNLFFPSSEDSIRIKELVKLINEKYADEFVNQELQDLLQNIEEVKIVDDDLYDIELFEYYVEILGVRIEVMDEHGVLGETREDFLEFCEIGLPKDQLSYCTISFLKKQIQEGYFFRELIR